MRDSDCVVTDLRHQRTLCRISDAAEAAQLVTDLRHQRNLVLICIRHVLAIMYRTGVGVRSGDGDSSEQRACDARVRVRDATPVRAAPCAPGLRASWSHGLRNPDLRVLKAVEASAVSK